MSQTLPWIPPTNHCTAVGADSASSQGLRSPKDLLEVAKHSWEFWGFLSCVKPGQHKTHPWKCPISVKARSSSTLLHRAHSPIVIWQLMKVITKNINRFELYFGQWCLVIVSKASTSLLSTPTQFSGIPFVQHCMSKKGQNPTDSSPNSPVIVIDSEFQSSTVQLHCQEGSSLVEILIHRMPVPRSLNTACHLSSSKALYWYSSTSILRLFFFPLAT